MNGEVYVVDEQYVRLNFYVAGAVELDIQIACEILIQRHREAREICWSTRAISV